MRIPLFSLMVCVCLAACADRRGELAVDSSPQAPINQPDTGAGHPGGGGSQGANQGPGGSGGGQSGGGNPGGGGGSGGGPVPEPSTLLLVGSGLAGAALLGRRRRKAQA